jgi:hypothetical protein
VRIRTVKPEWLEDDRVVGCSDAARVLSIALISMADDEGRGRLGPSAAARVWPLEPKKMGKAIRELEGWFVVAYEHGGQRYYQIRNWARHQKINRPSPSRIPAPSDDSLNAHGGLSEGSPTEGKGREGITDQEGKGREGAAAERAEIERVFSVWKKTHGSPRSQLTPDRRKRIRARLLEGYSAEMLSAAVRGALADPWLMGVARGATQAYRDLKTILRDSGQVDRLSALDGQPEAQKRGPVEPRPSHEYEDSEVPECLRPPS